MWIEAVTAKLKAVFWHDPEGTEEDHKNSTSYIQNSSSEVGLTQPTLKWYQSCISGIEAAKS